MKQRLLLFAGALLLPLLSQAQQNRVAGRVVDANTKEPIPFASISLQIAGTGALTNESGYFQLLGPDKFKVDSLVFMTLGYCRQAVQVEPGQSENLRIELSQGCMAGTHIIKCPVKPIASTRVSGRADNAEIITGLPGTQYAFFIENDQRGQTRRMRSVSFYVGEHGFPMAPFRIRIYEADGKHHTPAADLLTEPVVFVPTRSGQWFTSDLSRYNVMVPKKGYFVALQFEDFANQSPQLSPADYIPSGQIMRPLFDFKKSSMWSYTAEKGWGLVPESSSSRRYNAMVKLEVAGAD